MSCSSRDHRSYVKNNKNTPLDGEFNTIISKVYSRSTGMNELQIKVSLRASAIIVAQHTDLKAEGI